MISRLMVITLVLALCSVSSVTAFTWSEDFEGTLSPYWVTASGDGGFVGVVDDGSGNGVLKIDTISAGWAMAGMWVAAFDTLDATQDVTVNFRFYLQALSDEFLVVATNFTGAIVNGGEYWYNETGGKLFDMPTNEWVGLKYQFTPEGGTTHKI